MVASARNESGRPSEGREVPPERLVGRSDPEQLRINWIFLMVDEYDPYREALVLETETIWPDEYDDWEPSRKLAVATQLHADPKQASQREYVRLHTGFCRRIYVTPEDLERL